MSAKTVRLQGDEAKIDIATGAGHLQTGSAAGRISAIAAIASIERSTGEFALAAGTARRSRNDGGVVENSRRPVYIDRRDTAEGCAAIAAIHSFTAVATDTTGVHHIDGIIEIILIDIDRGIAARTDPAIAAIIISFKRRKAKNLAAVAASAN